MSEDTAPARRVIGVEEHGWTLDAAEAAGIGPALGRGGAVGLNAERILDLKTA
ncbi:hypothetical protein [Embleya sp. AB8]|uniref:hypothetical protein n=1 Tax=Embleya sp. AB8 TaxID=3156304 RepID=UPI003C766EB6